MSEYYSPVDSPSILKLAHFSPRDYPANETTLSSCEAIIFGYSFKTFATNINEIIDSINSLALLTFRYQSQIIGPFSIGSYYLTNIVDDNRKYCILLNGGSLYSNYTPLDSTIYLKITNVETNLIEGIFQHYEFDNSNITVLNQTSKIVSFDINTVVLPLNIVSTNGYVKILNTPSNLYDGLYAYENCTITTTTITTITLVFRQNYIKTNTNYISPVILPTNGTIMNNTIVIFNQFIITNEFRQDMMLYKLQENIVFLSFKRKNTNPLQLTNDDNNTLTYKNNSIYINPDNGRYEQLFCTPSSVQNAYRISLEETCPNDDNVYSYIIDFGCPNPSTKISNIYRDKKRPIIYSSQDISITSNLTIDSTYSGNIYLGSNITISPNLNIIPNSNYSYNQYYGKTYQIDNFKMFKKEQIIQFTEFNAVPGSNFNGILKINNISNDLNTLYCVPVLQNATLPTFGSGGVEQYYIKSFNGVVFKTTNILNDVGMDFSKFYSSQWITSDSGFSKFYNLCISLYKKSSDYSITDTSIYSNSELYFTDLYTGQVYNDSPSQLLFTNNKNNINLKELCMNHTLIIPLDNISANYTNISFHLLTISGSSDITFYSSNNTITSNTTDLSDFIISEFILVSGTSSNNTLYRINDSIVPTSNSIIISNDYTLINETNTSATLKANNINTSNSSITDLSVFQGGQTLIVYQTTDNNTAYVSNINSNSKYSIYIDSKNVITETPNYCSIEKSMINDELTKVSGSSNVDFNNNQLSLTDNNNDLSIFRPKQKLNITNSTSNNSNVTISDIIVPSNVSITIDETVNVETNSSAIISKIINFNIIGQPLEVKYNANYSDLYNYEDAQGNNAMVGSFSGQFSGELTYSIYNLYLGSRCAQINHGSGNIFIGNEGRNALSASESGATTYSNKFAIYKNNFVGILSQPLIGGDFTTGRVGINTITPENFNTSADVTITDTKLVVNGGVVANSYSPFTGCHIVKFANSNIASNLQAGMILSSTGKVKKTGIINTFCMVDLSKVQNDKTVFGIYAFSEESKSSNETEYIINSDGKYVKNPLYNNNMVTLHYSASLGEGCILVSNYGGDIQNGDYITTCPIGDGGYGSLQSDDILHSYTVAKCTETIDWSSINETISYNESMYKVYLAGCTYHCG